MNRDRFFLVLALTCLGIALSGFGAVYYLRALEIVPWDNIDAFSRYDRRLPIHLHIHGAALTLWFLLLVIQPCLVALRHVSLHRTLGQAGVIVAILVVTSAIYTVYYRDAYMVESITMQAAGNLVTILAFAICFAAAVRYRNRPAVHKRLMLIGSIALLPPALDRWNVYPWYRNLAEDVLGWIPVPAQFVTTLVVCSLMLLSICVYDLLKERRITAATLFGLTAIFVIAPAISLPVVATGFWATIVRAVS